MVPALAASRAGRPGGSLCGARIDASGRQACARIVFLAESGLLFTDLSISRV